MKLRHIIFIFLLFLDASKSLAYQSEDVVPFFGGSATAGERIGLGAFVGAAKLTCDTGLYGCLGYGLSAGHRFSDPSASFIEGGGVFLFTVIPAYAGVGMRLKNQRIAGGQLSIATGILPVFLVLRAYNENSHISGEATLGFLWPLKKIYSRL
jgi:hypothetical protein